MAPASPPLLDHAAPPACPGGKSSPAPTGSARAQPRPERRGAGAPAPQRRRREPRPFGAILAARGRIRRHHTCHQGTARGFARAPRIASARRRAYPDCMSAREATPQLARCAAPRHHSTPGGDVPKSWMPPSRWVWMCRATALPSSGSSVKVERDQHRVARRPRRSRASASVAQRALSRAILREPRRHGERADQRRVPPAPIRDRRGSRGRIGSRPRAASASDPAIDRSARIQHTSPAPAAREQRRCPSSCLICAGVYSAGRPSQATAASGAARLPEHEAPHAGLAATDLLRPPPHPGGAPRQLGRLAVEMVQTRGKTPRGGARCRGPRGPACRPRARRHRNRSPPSPDRYPGFALRSQGRTVGSPFTGRAGGRRAPGGC